MLLELKEYATEVDVEFVRKAVRAIGRCAIGLERAAEACINVLLELIQTKVRLPPHKLNSHHRSNVPGLHFTHPSSASQHSCFGCAQVNYVVQESIVVIKDIFRRYPNRYESIIATLCENLDTLDEPEAKAAMVWIIGEYAERIDNADELLETFLETFAEEEAAVQLQLLTATVKLFLKKPTEGPQAKIQSVLQMATQETDNPDLRDRAYVYWRLLSTDPEAAKDVVLAEKPVISDGASVVDPRCGRHRRGSLATHSPWGVILSQPSPQEASPPSYVLDCSFGSLRNPLCAACFNRSLLAELLKNVGSLASVYHKPPAAFVSRSRPAVVRADDLEGGDETEEDEADAGVSGQGASSAAVNAVRCSPILPPTQGYRCQPWHGGESERAREGCVRDARIFASPLRSP